MTTTLPIDAIKTVLLSDLVDHQTAVLTAPPGAGKSTKLPLWLLESEHFAGQKIYLLQPRRIAAKNIAVYLAEQLGEPVGLTVGYRLKNDSKVSKNTRLEVITEGILTQIIQHDPELKGVGLIVLDEFHERSLHGDLAFALSRDIQENLREDLKLLLMSATLASEVILKALPDAKGIQSEGRTFPITLSYHPPKSEKQWRENLISVIQHELRTEEPSSMLVFLPGVSDIHKVANALMPALPSHVQLHKLYGQLSIKEQQAVIAPAPEGILKIVLATNIAETSLTINGINLVIDSGLEKIATYHTDILTNHLLQRKISKASAIQRAGRAGRLQAGRCIRLFSEEDFGRRAEQRDSEILHGDILPLLIESARWGVKSLNELPLLELPHTTKENLAWSELFNLGLVTHQNQLTALGHKVSSLACHPRYARMVIQANELQQKHNVSGLLPLACVMAAMLEEKDIFSGEQARYDCDLTHRISTVVNGNTSKVAPKIHQQASKFHQSVTKEKFTFDAYLPQEYAGVLLALCYPERIAKARGTYGEYLTAQGKGISIHDEDALANEPYIVAANVSSAFNKKLQVRLAARVDLSLLQAWHLINENTENVVNYDETQGRIIAVEQVKVGALVLTEKNTAQALSPEKISALWQQKVVQHGIAWLKLPTKALKLLQRWRWVNMHVSESALPKVDDASLIEQLALWFSPYTEKVTQKKALLKLDYNAMLQSLMTYSQQQLLVQLAPEYFIGPTGRKCPISYSDEQSPKVSLPMQEIYGMQQSPCVGVTPDVARSHPELSPLPAVPLTLELLSPAQRPIQITQDLSTFWQGSYKAVQKDMKSNYPKHFWPEDPANAQPTNKTKRRLQSGK